MKKILVGLFLILVTVFIFVANSRINPADQVTLIEMIPNKFITNQEPIIYNETEQTSIETIMRFINNGLKASEVINHLTNGDFMFEVSFSNEDLRIFSIDFDMALPQAYMTVDDKTYLINSEATDAFVKDPNFSPYFNVDFIRPQIQLTIDHVSSPFYYQDLFEYSYFNKSQLTFMDTYAPNSENTESILPVAITDNTSMQISFEHEPDQVIQKTYNGETLIESNEVINGELISPTIEGAYTIELTCTWNESVDRNFSGSTVLSFFASLDKPTSFLLNQTSAYPGDTFAIFASYANEGDTFTVNASFHDKPINFYPYEEGYIGFIPIYAWLEPGTYQIDASTAGSDFTETFEVEILPKEFDVQHLIVTESTAAIMTNDNAAKDQVHIDRSRSNPVQEKLWEGAFVQPAIGRLTTDYNSTRYTNDNPTPSRHLALDIANIIGTSILAANNGKVTLSMELITTGNTLVIDHGMGIFTTYLHLNELLVNEGDIVSKGDLIAKMGTTGYSTGSHLHFSVWKDGTFLNPWTFFSYDPANFK